MRDAKVVQEFFEKEAMSWEREREHGPDSERKDGFQAVYAVLRSIVESFPQPPKLLDIGCGTGAHLRLLSPIVRSAIGLDLAEGMINEAKVLAERQIGPSSNLTFIRFDASDIENIGNLRNDMQNFDMVMIVGALEHMLEREKLLRALHDICTPSCRLVIVSPSKFSIPFLIERVKNFGNPPRLCPSDTHFSLGILKKIAQLCGWSFQFARPIVAPPSHYAGGPTKLMYQLDKGRAALPILRFFGTYCSIFTPIRGAV
jgi:SAM-dependent methyltransferase